MKFISMIQLHNNFHNKLKKSISPRFTKFNKMARMKLYLLLLKLVVKHYHGSIKMVYQYMSIV